MNQLLIIICRILCRAIDKNKSSSNESTFLVEDFFALLQFLHFDPLLLLLLGAAKNRFFSSVIRRSITVILERPLSPLIFISFYASFLLLRVVVALYPQYTIWIMD